MSSSFEYLFKTSVGFQKHVLSTLLIKQQKQGGRKYIHILCFHVVSSSSLRFPFVKFLLVQRPFNHLLLDLPFISIDDECHDDDKLQNKVCDHVAKLVLPVNNCDISYVGACLLNDDCGRVFAVVEVTAPSSLNRRALFVLPSEIVNSLHVCGFYIDEWITRLFVACPQLAQIHRCKTDTATTTSTLIEAAVYPIPDVGYVAFDDIYMARLAYLFGHASDNTGVWNFDLDVPKKQENNAAAVVVRFAVFYSLNSSSVPDLDLFYGLSLN